ncbi:long-chain fatty acid transport protein [Psychrobacter sp. PL15]|uniref:OmpP1/FadL family transporter n=1 Tax=Psychrobacter sp. PL15 TaxID=3071719 RepID=UPI002E0A3B7A|nr:long-chain fatty acid transport protein [Psychrobacter sp. PL15]
MHSTFHLKTLAVAIAALSMASMGNAAGLDRSGQDMTAFLQDGLYAEVVYTYIDADVSGNDNAYIGPDKKAYEQGNKIGDIAESYDFFRYGVKADINDTFSVGILYDEPFGAAALYTGDNDFVSQGDPDRSIQSISEGMFQNDGQAETFRDDLTDIIVDQNTDPQTRLALIAQRAKVDGIRASAAAEVGNAGQGTQVEVRSENITAILGAKFGANKNFQVYGGPVAQQIKANLKIRGLAYGAGTGYNANINPDQDYGYLAGISYSKPEIALMAALTYRSEIEHNADIFETYPVAPALGLPRSRAGTIEITTPESINFDFQTGINPTTLATARVRYVPWSDFELNPPLFNDVSKVSAGDDTGFPLLDYKDDQYLVELGLAKRLSPVLAVSGNIGWDSGAGDPATSLGPIDGYYSVGLGAKYNVTPTVAVSAGGKYLWFGDAKGEISSGKTVSDFKDNDGYILGVKLSYQAKQSFN